MSDSSDQPMERLAKISVKQVEHLLSILSTVEMRRLPFVRRAYEERAQHFEETLGFLTEVSWVDAVQDELQLTALAVAVCASLKDERLLREAILAALTSKSSPYRIPVGKYVRKFSIEGGRLKYRPSLSERVNEKPVRDLLMDLRTVMYSASDEAYELAQTAGALYVWARNGSRVESRAGFEANQKRREELGFAAELAILDYEKRRLGAELASKVEHISAEQPFACYDIKSVTTTAGQLSERYIEVKAVPAESLQFYWSRTEIEVAQVLGNRYFLYLLPYRVSGGFDTEALVIIADPYPNLYTDRDGWEIEEDVIICRRRRTSSSP